MYIHIQQRSLYPAEHDIYAQMSGCLTCLAFFLEALKLFWLAACYEAVGMSSTVKPNLITLDACRLITAGIMNRSLHPVTHRQAGNPWINGMFVDQREKPGEVSGWCCLCLLLGCLEGGLVVIQKFITQREPLESRKPHCIYVVLFEKRTCQI